MQRHVYKHRNTDTFLKTKMIMLCLLRQYKWTKTETIEFVDLGEKILSNAINKSNETVMFYGCKSDEFTLVSLVRICGCKIDN